MFKTWASQTHYSDWSVHTANSFGIFIMYKNVFREKNVDAVSPSNRALKVPISATPSEVNHELLQKKSLGSWMGHDIIPGNDKSRLRAGSYCWWYEKSCHWTKRHSASEACQAPPRLAWLADSSLTIFSCHDAWEPGRRLCHIIPAHVTVTSHQQLLPSKQVCLSWNFQFVTFPTCHWECFKHVSHGDLTDLYHWLYAVIFFCLIMTVCLLFQGWFTDDIPWSWSFKCFEGRYEPSNFHLVK